MTGAELDGLLEDGAEGRFWSEGGSQVPGKLTRGSGGVQVVTQGAARTSHGLHRKQGDGFIEITSSGDPKDLVADNDPIPLLGVLDDGRKVTISDARLASVPWPPPGQTLYGKVLLVGAHAPTSATTFVGARFSLPEARIWRGIFPDSPEVDVTLTEGIGKLRAFTDGADSWLELTMDVGFTDFEWQRQFVGRCVTLLRLWTNIAWREQRVQLLPSTGEPWVDRVFVGERKSETSISQDCLLAPARLKLSVVADALGLFQRLAPIPDMASKHLMYEVTLELAVLANASSLEGLHRRCRGDVKPYATLNDKRTRKVALAAAEAAADKMVELGAISANQRSQSLKHLKMSFKFFNYPDFKDRLRDFVGPAEIVAPGLIGQDHEYWISTVVSVRNFEAHRFEKEPRDYQEQIDEYYQLATSTEWVLRLVLLLELGVPLVELRSRLRDHQRFQYALANMDACEFSWPGSRLAEYRAGTTPSVGTSYWIASSPLASMAYAAGVL
ncbi:hypothetical protein OG218_24365 [Kineococcus sp. NBC_00420]|uniref:HEPN domain-containing protein n=1 Tax=Kineococcus sp. NBC_00420 TaxID=2903564 RepID=UPI002E235159